MFDVHVIFDFCQWFVKFRAKGKNVVVENFLNC